MPDKKSLTDDVKEKDLAFDKKMLEADEELEELKKSLLKDKKA
ncbi:hypothetical protein SFC50_02155 [Bacillus infantis]